MPAFDSGPVRTAVKAKIVTVANVGTVHDYERFANTTSGLIAEYVNSQQAGARINGWFVSRAAYREVFIDTGRWVRDDDWKVVGYMGLDDNDATEKKISMLVDAIADAFRNDDTLGGVVGTCIIDTQGKKAGLQLDELGHVLFAGVLCHRARCSLTTRSFI